MGRMVSFDVYKYGKNVDTVFADAHCSTEEVQDSLVEHDGYDPSIIVVRRC